MSDEDVQKKFDYLKSGGKREQMVASFRRNNKDLLNDTFGKGKY